MHKLAMGTLPSTLHFTETCRGQILHQQPQLAGHFPIRSQTSLSVLSRQPAAAGDDHIVPGDVMTRTPADARPVRIQRTWLSSEESEKVNSEE